MRHPRDVGSAEVEAFPNVLLNERLVSPFTPGRRGWPFCFCTGRC